MTQSNDITGRIISCAIDVHKQLGPGLLESAYQACLHYKLIQCGLVTERELPLPVCFEGVKLDCGYRIDLMVNDSIIIEVKSIEKLAPIHTAQLLTYLKLSNRRIGLLINFNEYKLIDGIKRVSNGF